MASKDDVIKALRMKYDRRISDLRTYIPFPKEDEIKKICDKVEREKKNKETAFSEIRKIGGYDVKISCSWYSVSTEIVDANYVKLKKEQTEFERKRETESKNLDKKFNEIMEKVLLFGVSDELLKLVEGF